MRNGLAVSSFIVLIVLSATGVVIFTPSAQADWVPSDGHKMHFPQLPDENGWDVNATMPKVLADDWMCSSTGPIKDIHFWGSWRRGITGQITNVRLSIHSNIAAGPNGYSAPGELLWYWDGPVTNLVPIDPQAQEGWYDPNTGQYNRPDHTNYFQYNVVDFPNPFIQQQGTIYWLDIQVQVADPVNTHWGWKTADLSKYPLPHTGQHFMDDAVWTDWTGGPAPLPGQWHELVDPITGQSLDLAFVITPEPGSLALVGVGLAAVACLRRRGN